MTVNHSDSDGLKGIVRSLRRYVARNPTLKKLYYSKFQRPDLPDGIGMSLYQARSSWELQPDSCPCDIQFVEYLKQQNIQGKNIFHFGTGEHHFIGLQNQWFDRPNEVLGITASALEHQSYVQLVLQNTALPTYYKVLFADIYTLTSNILPVFDLVTLFHLCEFYIPENAHLTHQTDESLVQLFLDKLSPDGRLCFYSGSRHWFVAKPIVETFEAAGKLRQIDAYQSLLIYTKT
ncbi:hypothetical protein ACQ4M3_28615 [Leptolyngbya sp. AN03gr2]|uniref:hypothetical protein n=1 Tax=unclassified Leptolyngbya TaxID=2650499 RepID=UPI003D320915